MITWNNDELISEHHARTLNNLDEDLQSIGYVSQFNMESDHTECIVIRDDAEHGLIENELIMDEYQDGRVNTPNQLSKYLELSNKSLFHKVNITKSSIFLDEITQGDQLEKLVLMTPSNKSDATFLNVTRMSARNYNCAIARGQEQALSIVETLANYEGQEFSFPEGLSIFEDTDLVIDENCPISKFSGEQGSKLLFRGTSSIVIRNPQTNINFSAVQFELECQTEHEQERNLIQITNEQKDYQNTRSASTIEFEDCAFLFDAYLILDSKIRKENWVTHLECQSALCVNNQSKDSIIELNLQNCTFEGYSHCVIAASKYPNFVLKAKQCLFNNSLRETLSFRNPIHLSLEDVKITNASQLDASAAIKVIYSTSEDTDPSNNDVRLSDYLVESQRLVFQGVKIRSVLGRGILVMQDTDQEHMALVKKFTLNNCKVRNCTGVGIEVTLRGNSATPGWGHEEDIYGLSINATTVSQCKIGVLVYQLNLQELFSITNLTAKENKNSGILVTQEAKAFSDNNFGHKTQLLEEQQICAKCSYITNERKLEVYLIDKHISQSRRVHHRRAFLGDGLQFNGNIITTCNVTMNQKHGIELIEYSKLDLLIQGNQIVDNFSEGIYINSIAPPLSQSSSVNREGVSMDSSGLVSKRKLFSITNHSIQIQRNLIKSNKNTGVTLDHVRNVKVNITDCAILSNLFYAILIEDPISQGLLKVQQKKGDSVKDSVQTKEDRQRKASAQQVFTDENADRDSGPQLFSQELLDKNYESNQQDPLLKLQDVQPLVDNEEDLIYGFKIDINGEIQYALEVIHSSQGNAQDLFGMGSPSAFNFEASPKKACSSKNSIVKNRQKNKSFGCLGIICISSAPSRKAGCSRRDKYLSRESTALVSDYQANDSKSGTNNPSSFNVESQSNSKSERSCLIF